VRFRDGPAAVTGFEVALPQGKPLIALTIGKARPGTIQESEDVQGVLFEEHDGKGFCKGDAAFRNPFFVFRGRASSKMHEGTMKTQVKLTLTFIQGEIHADTSDND
jgi:hypothetical protein